MTHSERDVQIVLSEHPDVAEKLIDEMDRAGRDYMRLRAAEAERDEAVNAIAQWARQFNEMKRRAEAAETRVAKLEQAIEQIDQDWITRCRCAMDQRDAAVFRLREMQAAREKGGK